MVWQQSPQKGADGRLLTLFLRFLRFGFLAWGGPIAQIAMIRRELVEETGWVSPEHFNRLLAAYQVLPGPEAHELCVHIGTIRAGRWGGLLAGLGFMLPGFMLVLGLSALYARLALDRPPLASILLGLQVGVVAIIVRAVHRIGQHILIDRWAWAIAVVAFMSALFGVSFWVSLPAGGIAFALAKNARTKAAVAVLALAALVGASLIAAGRPLAPSSEGGPQSVSAALLFWSGLKAGLLTFGGAYTAIPFVRGDAVGRGWISDHQFLDGLALSGVVPAPLIIFATFVGYQAGGLAGAVAITVGIFLPAFAFGMVFHRSIERVVANERLHRVLEGVAAGVVGLIAATALELAKSLWTSLTQPLAGLALFALCLAMAFAWKSKFNLLAIIALAGIGGALFLS